MNSMYGGVYIPNLANAGEKYGIGQYRFPHCYELAGQKFNIDAGNAGNNAGGRQYKLAFTCRKNAEFEGGKSDYECLKLEKDTYFIRFGTNVAVLDLEQCLATLILGGEFVSGAIACPERGNEVKAHADAGDDMAGTKVRWLLGADKYMNHEYLEGGKVRAAWSKDTVLAGIGKKTFRDGWEPAAEQYDTLPVKAVKIKGPMYLVDIKGGVQAGVCAPAGTNRVVALQDYDRMMLVGCVLGEGFEPVMISGYAKFLD